jgi:quinol monooxygenase YgiN
VRTKEEAVCPFGCAVEKESVVGVLVRVFRIEVPADRHGEFEALFQTISVDAVRKAEGSLAVEIARPSQWAPNEYAMISKWKSVAALAAFAGSDWQQAMIPPGMDRFVQRCWVHHYELFSS